MRRPGIKLILAELYRARLLIEVLTLREIRARYRGSLLGYLWTLLNPIMLLGVYTLVFSVYARLDMEHYSIYMFTGLLPWLWFSTAVGNGSTTITRNTNLITRSCFPPQVLPTVEVLSQLANYVLAIPVLLVWAWAGGLTPGWPVLMLPVLIAIQLAFTLGLVLAVSALTVYYRDVQFLVGNFLTFWFFLTPILYSLDHIPRWVQPWVHTLNPLSPYTIAYADIVHGQQMPTWYDVYACVYWAALSLWFGCRVFARYRFRIAEEI